MSVASFLRRRFSMDAHSGSASQKQAPCSTATRPLRDSTWEPSSSDLRSPRLVGASSRRSRIAASLDSARRRFSLQPSTPPVVDYHQHMQSIALREKHAHDVGSLPDLQHERPNGGARSPQAKRVSVVAGGDRAIFPHKQRKHHSFSKAP
ncbi:unnamed protein product [Caenorhabditis auriculariae]|uniref:Uncharacterized protein n=1 Tax=Caenorhabditis auriculariae TaxID=2777116 RepID=A0A8S1HJ90_9PELO|nr:unnamed protein product [Caenorhabditis auriculariae]